MNERVIIQPRRPQLTELERAHFRCIAELMTLRPKKIIGNADRFDVLDRADYLEAFLGAVDAYAKVVVADLASAFPPENWKADDAGEEIIGFIPDETDRLASASSAVADVRASTLPISGKPEIGAAADVVGALKNAVDLMIDGSTQLTTGEE